MIVYTFNAGFDGPEERKEERKKDKRLKEKMEPRIMSYQRRGRCSSFVFFKIIDVLYQGYKRVICCRNTVLCRQTFCALKSRGAREKEIFQLSFDLIKSKLRLSRKLRPDSIFVI